MWLRCIWEANSVLEVDGINVFYDDFHVLHDVSLNITGGEAVGLIGANGHGKSTLLKAICGLLPIASGTILFEGDRIDGMSTPELVERGIVYVAEERHLFRDMTVRENLLLGAYRPRAQRQREASLDKVFSLYPRLCERQSQLAKTLSGGEAQMLALGRGLMSAARFMAIDEPSLGLAPNLVSDMLATIGRVNEEGMTVLLVEQNTAQLRAFIERIYLLEEGHVACEGSIDELTEADQETVA